MKIVVTGALGHIGSRLIHGLAPGDFSEVVLMDNLLTQRYGSLFNLPAGVPFRFFEEDILTADLSARFRGAHAVVHLAAITTAAASFDLQDEIEKVNYEGTRRVALACVEAGCRLIVPSTTSVYGPAGDTVNENCADSDLNPQTPYAAGKLKAERMLEAMGRAEGLRFVSCRFGTVFGVSPGMRFHTAVNKFVWQACLGRPLSLWRTALNQKRPYLDVEDAVRALAFILREDLFGGEVYNIATTNESLSSIVDAIRRYVPGLSVELVDSPAMNERSYAIETEKFTRLGFAYRGSLDQGIRETVARLKNLQ
jgi:UDP-glucose 4-epimerase